MTDPKPLSPAAQAVMDALGPSEQIELVTRCIAAAALRAAACQLTSAKAMDTLRAIANELDPPSS